MNNQVPDRLVKYFRQQVSRRRTLRYLAGVTTALILTSCNNGNDRAATSTALPHANNNSRDGNPAACTEIPDETGGPFPADGSNGPNVLADSAILRRDIRTNLDGSNVQPGAVFQVTLTIVDIAQNCAPVVGVAVYIWHCNATGEYSAYSGIGQPDQTGQTYLRGVQVTDKNGQVTFTTVYPGRYRGRATHIHARLYPDDSFKAILKTTQFAFAEATNNQLYTSSRNYASSASTPEMTNAQDYEFSDGLADQLLDMSGSPASGYIGSIVVGINV